MNGAYVLCMWHMHPPQYNALLLCICCVYVCVCVNIIHHLFTYTHTRICICICINICCRHDYMLIPPLPYMRMRYTHMCCIFLYAAHMCVLIGYKFLQLMLCILLCVYCLCMHCLVLGYAHIFTFLPLPCPFRAKQLRASFLPIFLYVYMCMCVYLCPNLSPLSYAPTLSVCFCVYVLLPVFI